MKWVNAYIGIPFAPHGRDRAGLDCYGLFRLALGERRGVWLPTCLGYEDPADPTETAPYIAENMGDWLPVPLDEARPFDGLLLRVRAGVGTHLGLVSRPPWFLHVQRGIDSVHERYDSIQWRKRILGAWRHKALA